MSSFDDLDVMEKMNNLNLLYQSKSSSVKVSDSIEFKSTSDKGVGIFANNIITEVGTVLISIPFELCISIDVIINSKDLKQVFIDSPGYLQYTDEVLAIGLLYARLFPTQQQECSWIRHVDVMPKEFNSTLYWSEQELLHLQPCTVYHLTKMMKKQIQNDFESLYLPLIQQHPHLFGNLTIDLYTWALSVVYSRAIEITRNNENVRCIVPLLDMANHNPLIATRPSDTFRFDESIDCIQLLNSVPLQPGDECFAVYGLYPNSKLLYTYGFVVLDNPVYTVVSTCSHYSQ
jgi:[ribulose-bisphosphate carboxylase]-lysine N-methyltransferase